MHSVVTRSSMHMLARSIKLTSLVDRCANPATLLPLNWKSKFVNPFLLFQDKDYCILTVPHLVPEFPLLQSFIVSYYNSWSLWLSYQLESYWWDLTRPKQLSMAASARVIWLCACALTFVYLPSNFFFSMWSYFFARFTRMGSQVFVFRMKEKAK